MGLEDFPSLNQLKKQSACNYV